MQKKKKKKKKKKSDKIIADIYLHQPGNGVGFPLNQTHWCPGGSWN